MPWKNTAANYGTVAKWLHWSIALLFLAAYCAVYYRHWFTVDDTPENWLALQLHLSFGISIGALVLLRVIWKLTQRQPEPEPGTVWEHRAAKLGHLALYAVMILAPITGYVGTGVATEFFTLFDIPKFADTGLFQWLVVDTLGLTFEEFEAPIDFIHKNILGAWLIWLLIAGHVAAALYHHFIKGDRTLRKMTTGR